MAKQQDPGEKKRRDRGEGSIRQRPNGAWEARADFGWLDGKRSTKSFYGKTEREVKRKLASAISNFEKGLPITDDSLSVERFLKTWLEAKTVVRPTTHADYTSIVHFHLIPALGKKKLTRLTPDDVQHLLTMKSKAGLSPRRVQYIRAVLRMALNHAIKWGKVVRNVAALAEPPRSQHFEVSPMSPPQVHLFLRAIKGDTLEHLYITAITTGLRKGELLGLSWGAVDLDRATLTVRNTLQRVNGRLQLLDPKTEKSRRAINLSRATLTALKAQRTRQVEARLAAGPYWQDSGMVFTSNVGTPLDPRNLTRRFQIALKKAGLPHQRFHDLRHCAASLLLAQGIAPRVIMELLGHSQIGTTMDIYSHVMPAMLQEAADQMDAIMGT